MAKRKEAHEKENAERWLLTYADMITLLMLFFIVLYSMSSVDTERFRAVSQALESVFAGGNWGVLDAGMLFRQAGTADFQGKFAIGSQHPYKNTSRPISRILKQASEVFKPEIKAKLLRTTLDERGLVITLASDAYFDRGSAAVNDDMKEVLKKVAGIINSVPNFVRIEGHTDNSPVSPEMAREGYETNWDLSSARSVHVLRYLTEEERVDPKKLSAVAFGQYRPIDDNSSPEGRSFNRRVDIVILKDRMLKEDEKEKPGVSRPLPDQEWR